VDQKTLLTLEYAKVLERLARLCSFSPSAEKARNLQPVNNIDIARILQAETSEASQMLSHNTDVSIGGARDIRPSVYLTDHNGVLTPAEFLDVRSTLVASRTISNFFTRTNDAYPHLGRVAAQIIVPPYLIDAISSVISEHAEIRDSASVALATIRHDMRISHERLHAKLQRMISDPHNTPFLQETLITQRDGRYVLPLRAEFKGRIKAIVHDQSSSGATLFIEPLGVVDLNNQLRELQLAERDEERRILTTLSQQVAAHGQEILSSLDAIAELDFIFARARYAMDIGACEPVIHHIPVNSESQHPGCVIRLNGARHPLLDPQTVVPIDLELNQQTYALVITGPNTGGKTVTLKTIGLLALMAQSGLHIPAHSGSEISLFQDIYADIGDEQSIEQSLSTFSGHITNIIHILEEADRRSLIILDELGAGTDPQEGAALARALLTHLLERGITTLVTTHHPELKAFAHATPGVVNASMEFDLESLRPTYRLTVGLPGRSNAIAIAQRLGMPIEIIGLSRAGLDQNELHTDDLLDDIHRQRDLARQTSREAERALHEAQEMRAEVARQLEQVEEERMQVMDQARSESMRLLGELEDEVRQARRSLSHARQPLDAVESVQEQVEHLQETVSKPVERRVMKKGTLKADHTPRLGERVLLRSLNAQGVLTSLGEEEAEVQVGVLRVRARLADIQTLTPLDEQQADGLQPARKSKSRHAEYSAGEQHSAFEMPASPGIELDIRGQRSDEAVDLLDRYLDSAYLAGLPWVRVIHGKGTGKLRQVVRQALIHHPHVSSFESGDDKEGGEGVTIAKLRV
jgi:DNA mismatch repair protein MutS2